MDQKLRVWLEKLAVRLRGHGILVETADLFYVDGGPSRFTGKSVTRGDVKLVWGTQLCPENLLSGTGKREAVLAISDGDREGNIFVRVCYQSDAEMTSGRIAPHLWYMWASGDIPDAFRVFERFQGEPEEITENEQLACGWIDEVVTIFLAQPA